jgi:hypothetical protein
MAGTYMPDKSGIIPRNITGQIRAQSSGVVVCWPRPQCDSQGKTRVKRLEVLDLFELAEIFSNSRPKILGDKGKVFDVYIALIGLENGLKKFAVEQAAFPLTRDSAIEAVRAIEAVMMESFFKEPARENFKDGLDINGEMHMWALYDVRAKLEQFRHVLAVECRKSETYFIERVVGFDLPTLLHSAEENIHHTIRPCVPGGALSEIREAGRCLALENYTASGFHTLRAGLKKKLSDFSEL